ncbi:MAG: alkaline phosphatase family protein [Ramlibacter sp.]|uniref:alkaline phosphatase family protein n=1 Tax=Ramlibacter sp. TaxID=1917967 RepID=UPI002618B7C4|nr:alkaline phosphatase family protein [Ramlibacter sp.]MDB5749852.1 alkaline phosphatase family protein [Ramlibacter sp.]
MNWRRTAGVLACLALVSCAAVEPLPRPKLVVLLVIDGLPQRQVTGYREQFAADGIARFLQRGAWFGEAHFGHAVTVTAAGHATLLTGASPHRTGIIGNDWRDLDTGERVYSVADTTAHYIHHETRPLDGTSPRNLRAESLGDVLRRRDPRSRVIGISGKDRGAILPAGKAGTAYMYMATTGEFASSTHYMPRHPAWVDAFNRARPADRWFKAEWKPLLPPPAYAGSVPDAQSWFGPRGGQLPMLMGAADATPGPAYYASLLEAPYADALTLDFARAAVAGEQLGRDDAPDILSVSLSGHDHVNHRWSAESRLSHDHLLQVDRLLQAFWRDLDASVGRDNYIAVLTSDHGFMPAPEVLRAQGREAGRLPARELLGRVNGELERRFGAPKLVAFISAQALVLDRKLLAERQLDLDGVAAATRDILAADPAIAAAYTRRELASGSRAGAPWFEAMRRSWHGARSGDVQYALKPHWMPGAAVATHGSPHPYDTHVPLMLWGPRWIRPGQVSARADMTDLAPTLARLLGVPAPAASEGKPLPLP